MADVYRSNHRPDAQRPGWQSLGLATVEGDGVWLLIESQPQRPQLGRLFRNPARASDQWRVRHPVFCRVQLDGQPRQLGAVLIEPATFLTPPGLIDGDGGVLLGGWPATDSPRSPAEMPSTDTARCRSS